MKTATLALRLALSAFLLCSATLGITIVSMTLSKPALAGSDLRPHT